jgi:predicted nucleic acid-binding protein
VSGEAERTITRYVVDASVVLRLLEMGEDPSAELRLLAPTLMRSEVLDALYRSVRMGEITEKVGRERLAAFSRMKVRYLGDKVLRSEAWKIADQLGWESTYPAEYVALTRLQADALVTLYEDLGAELGGLVVTAPLDVLVPSESQ